MLIVMNNESIDIEALREWVKGLPNRREFSRKIGIPLQTLYNFVHRIVDEPKFSVIQKINAEMRKAHSEEAA